MWQMDRLDQPQAALQVVHGIDYRSMNGSNWTLATSDARQTETLSRQDTLIFRDSHFLVTTKLSPYGPVDFMIMRRPLETDRNAGYILSLHQMSDGEINHLLKLAQDCCESLKKKFGNNRDFTLGLNLGTAQTIKIMHLHVVDTGAYHFEPLAAMRERTLRALNGEGEKTMKRILVDEASFAANEMLAEKFAKAGFTVERNANGTVKISLGQDPFKCAQELKIISQILYDQFLELEKSSSGQTLHPHKNPRLDWGENWAASLAISVNEQAVTCTLRHDPGENRLKMKPGWMESMNIALARTTQIPDDPDGSIQRQLDHIRVTQKELREWLARASIAKN